MIFKDKNDPKKFVSKQNLSGLILTEESYDFPKILIVEVSNILDDAMKSLYQYESTSCYFDRYTEKDNMSLNNFKSIIDQCKDIDTSIILTGSCDPNRHPDFQGMVEYCNDLNMRPSIITSGTMIVDPILDLFREYCDSIIVRWYNHPNTHLILDRLISSEIKTGLYFLLNSSTIKDANLRLSLHGDFHRGIDSIVFCKDRNDSTDGTRNIDTKDARIARFLKYMTTIDYDFDIGVDSFLLSSLKNVDESISYDRKSYEEGNISAYITSDMKMIPYKNFQTDSMDDSFDLTKNSIKSIWKDNWFEEYRKEMMV